MHISVWMQTGVTGRLLSKITNDFGEDIREVDLCLNFCN